MNLSRVRRWACWRLSGFYLLSLDLTPLANGSVGGDNPTEKSALIPNGGATTVVPCSPEVPLANGVANGHVTPVQESPFTGYIIAMHRKMVRPHRCSVPLQKNHL